MKARILSIVLVLLFVISCSRHKADDFRQNLLTYLSLISGDPVNVKGKVMKGEIKNALVRIIPLGVDGSCDRSSSAKVLARTYTDSEGKYSVTYARSGQPVCVVVSPHPDGGSTMYDEKSKKDIPWTDSSFYLQSVTREPATVKPDASDLSSASKMNTKLDYANVSPLTRIASKRLETLGKDNSSRDNLDKLSKQANQEVVLRFGLFSNSASSINTNTPSGVDAPKFQVQEGNNSLSISDTVPEISNYNVDLSSDSEEAKKMKLILGGISQVANNVKNTSTVTGGDVENVIQAFEKSMQSGEFKSTDENGEAIRIGLDENETNLGESPLKNVLQEATIQYAREGGAEDLSLSIEEVAEKVTFFDASEPGFTPSAATFSGKQEIKIESVDPAQKIYYTTDGTSPVCEKSSVYTEPVILDKLGETTLKAIACKDSQSSKIRSGVYKIVKNIIAKPSVTPDAGEYNNSVSVTLSLNAGSKIYYTLDGSLPSCDGSSGTEYSAAISMNVSFKLSAIACNGSLEESREVVKSYRIIQPPYGLSYASTSSVYTKNGSILPNFATVSGENLSFSVSPNLPSGLSFDTVTGRITGTPTSSSELLKYTVTAKNTAGETKTEIQIAVNEEAPTYLGYTEPAVTYTQNTLIQPNSPLIAGSGLSYKVEPALPSGLVLNSKTGVISGIPSTVNASTKYTVTATNTGGSISTELVLTVNDAAPSSLNYGISSLLLTKDVSISPIMPSVTGTVTAYTVSPSLPPVLKLDPSTGKLYGTPSALQLTPETYTVTASNVSGSSVYSFQITVEDSAPKGLSYPVSSLSLTKGVSLSSIIPVVSGTVTAYSVSPSLPSGLVLNTRTGELSGIPQSPQSVTTYTITAVNTKGSVSFPLYITVEDTAPSALSYVNSSYRYTKGVTISPIVPSVTGTVTRYSVAPSLPAGLNINSITGVISGTPEAATTISSYTVTASNPKGSISFPLSITVSEGAPSGLNYAGSPYIFTKASPIQTLKPNLTGTASSYTVSPALPSGLNINSVTGEISGTPLSLAANTTYTVTASNAYGSVSFPLQLTVNDYPPYSLSYSKSAYIFTKGISIAALSPSISGTVISYSVSPALPSGLSINQTTGVISGTPTAVSGTTTYLVVATNSAGSTSISLNLSIVEGAPTTLSYSSSSYTYTRGVTIASLSPTVTGTVSSYSVSPALPQGLSLNVSTGVISGTPELASASNTYTVTAANPSGSTAYSFSIQVTEGAPSSLVYAGSPYVLTQNLAMSPVTPALTGTATSFSITPSLPSGLSLNATTGVLSGNPQVSAVSQTYTVTATNSYGSTTASFSLEVATAYYVVRPTVSGLLGSGLQLSDGTNTISPTANGSWAFPARASGLSYNVTVATQPTNPWQTCSVTNGSGTLTVSDVTNVTVSCVTNTYTMGGTISGFGSGTDLSITDGAGNTLTLPAGSSTFTFPLRDSGSSYSVTIATQPTSPWQTCTVTNGSGNLTNANITNVSISCTVNTYTMSGFISGQANTSTLIINNGTANVTLTGQSSDYNYTENLNSGTSYNYTIVQQPPGQYCVFVMQTLLSGTVTNSNLNNFGINCVNGYLVSGHIQQNPPAPINMHLYQGNVTTLAGNGVTAGTADGTGAAGQFNTPSGITFDGTYFYVADTGNHKIKRIDSSGNVTSIAGNGIAGNTDGSGTSISSLNSPRGLTTDGTYLYISESSGNRIKRMRISSGYVETLAGDNSVVSPAASTLDGIGTAAKFNTPAGIVVDGNSLIIVERGSNAIRELNLNTLSVSTLTVSGAALNQAEGIALVGNYLYIANLNSHNILKVDKTSGVSVVLAGGAAGEVGYIDAVGTTARFNHPHGIVSDEVNLYIADFDNNLIRQLEISSGRVTTLAGTGTGGTSTDGIGIAATFNSPKFMTSDGKNLYVVMHHAIRKLTNNGLVGYWPLTTSAADHAGTNNGTLYNSPAFTAADRFAVANSAITFNGSNQFIEGSDSGLPSGGNPRTSCAWINPQAVINGLSLVFTYGTNTAYGGHGIAIAGNGTKLTGIMSSNFGGSDFTAPYNLATNQWTHICTTYSGSSAGNVVGVYANGKLIGQTTTGNWNTTLSGLMRIGSQITNAQYFNGNIADVRIYSRVLNEGEINELAQNAAPAQVGSTYSTGATGLLADFHLDGGSNNSSGAIPDLGLTGSTGGNFLGKDGDANGSRMFDISSSNTLSGTTLGLPLGGAPRTLCTWINPVSYPPPGGGIPGWYFAAGYGGTSTSSAFMVGVYNNSGIINLTLDFGNDSVMAAYNPALNTWTHVCGVYDGSTAYLYANGMLLNSAAKSINTTTGSFTIGANTSGSSFFNGKIDDVRIYNNALNQTQIRQLATQVPTGLVARYDFNGDANDVSGFGANGTVYGATLTSDRYGNSNSAYNFNHNNQNYIEAPQLFLPTGSSSRTLCAYIRPQNLPPTAPDPQRAVLYYGTATTSGANGLIFAFDYEVAVAGYADDLSLTYRTSQNTWNFFCGTFDGSTARLYYNGRELINGTKSWNTGTGNFFIGKSLSTVYFNGDIDDVRIYNRVLTESEIRALSGYHPMQVTSWNPTVASSSLQFHVAADSFSNQADNTTVGNWPDISGNGFLGTQYNGPVFRTGANGLNGKPAIQFNGTNQYFDFGAQSIAYNGATVFAVAKNSISDYIGRPILSYELASGGCVTRVNLEKDFTNPTNYYFEGPASSATISATLNESLILTGILEGTSAPIKLAKNGNAATSGANVSLSGNNSCNLRAGGRTDTADRFQGLISEILLFKEALGVPDKDIVECYLSSKYNIPIGHSCP
ncbi:MAG: putative Ig domain-containing protein [Leptospiraceae bacterium]|nr:putative Ig domain-containing protein [Leptospiraceae bacterium]